MKEIFLIVNIMEKENYIKMVIYFMMENLKMGYLMEKGNYIKEIIKMFYTMMENLKMEYLMDLEKFIMKNIYIMKEIL